MNLIERATLLHYHRHRIDTHGVQAPEALGWRDDHSQSRRFEAIAACADFEGASVLDIGCGKGDFKRYLDARFSEVRYLGIDLVPDFIDAARRAHGDNPQAVFMQGDFNTLPLPRADIVVASGVLGYRSANPRYACQAIARMFAASRSQLIFNFLDEALFTDSHPLLTGRCVADIVAFCEQLSAEVRVMRGATPEDVMVSLAV